MSSYGRLTESSLGEDPQQASGNSRIKMTCSNERGKLVVEADQR
jgi:hypothetical protein